MISAKRIFFASAIAPLIIGLPIFGFALLGAIFASPLAAFDDHGFLSPLEIAINFAGLIYLLLVAGILTVSLTLKFFDALSRRALMAAAVVMAFLISGLISCDWKIKCEVEILFPNLLLFFCIITSAFFTLVFTWWRLGNR